MSGTFPAAPGPRDVEITSIAPTLVSIAHSLKTQRRSRGGQRFSFRLVYAPLTRAQFAPLWGFLMKQRGQFETFQFVLPAPLKTPLGTATGSPTVNNQAGSPEELQTGSRTVQTSGWTPGVTGILKASDFMLFTGHTKVYQVTGDANSDGSGNAAVPIEPGLYAGPAHGAAITVNNVPFTVAMTEDTQRATQRLRPYYEFELNLIEVF